MLTYLFTSERVNDMSVQSMKECYS